VKTINTIIAFVFVLTPIWILLSHIGTIVGLPVGSMLTLWIICGEVVIRVKRQPAPQLRTEFIDLPRALERLWWMLWWPRYLLDRR